MNIRTSTYILNLHIKSICEMVKPNDKVISDHIKRIYKPQSLFYTRCNASSLFAYCHHYENVNILSLSQSLSGLQCINEENC